MDSYFVDGTYELFRYHFALPSHVTAGGMEVAGTRGVLSTIMQMIDEGVTHLGVATDHVIESFRNDMWPGYKSSAGIDPRILGQFQILEDALAALGVALWPMTELEADDAMASAAARANLDPEVGSAFICSPDKDLGQCVGGKVFQVDRRQRKVFDSDAVRAKFGVDPASVADYLALVGDSADGYPGLPGWGAKSAAAILSRYGHLEDIPTRSGDWDASVRGAPVLAQTLVQQRDDAFLFRDIATVRTTAATFTTLEDLRWRGPLPEFDAIAERLEQPGLATRAHTLAERINR
jgi:5'-3' exonuclease